MLYTLLHGKMPQAQLRPLFCDVRDVALAHVRALILTTTETRVSQKQQQQRRFLVSGGYFTFEEAVAYLASTRPELSSRLPTSPIKLSVSSLPGPVCRFDTEPAERYLGIKFRDWKESVDDTIASLLAMESGSVGSKLKANVFGDKFMGN